MVVGSARRLRQASQAASMVSNTRFESQFWRKYCQMFSTGLSSGAREGRKTRVMFFGTTRRPVVCQPARSRRSTAWAPRRTRLEISTRWSCIASLSGHGERRAGAARRADGAEQVGAFVALIGGLAWARAAPRPLPHEAVLLADAG